MKRSSIGSQIYLVSAHHPTTDVSVIYFLCVKIVFVEHFYTYFLEALGVVSTMS